MLATLTFAGLRIGELCALRWRDVDLARGWLTVGGAKTDAGRRSVKIRGALRDELLGCARSSTASTRTRTCSGPRTGERERATTSVRGCSAAAVKRADKSARPRSGPAAAAGQADAALAAPHVLLAAVRARRGPRHRHGRNGAHRPRRSRSASTGRRCAAARREGEAAALVEGGALECDDSKAAAPAAA